MRFVSTEGKAAKAGLAEALFRGLAPDGGLYVPEHLPPFSVRRMEEMQAMDWPDLALAVARHILGDDLDPQSLERVVREALDFPVPLWPLTRQIQILELFHGPTLAFKDVGARFMAHLMAHFRGDDAEPLTILTATSGDTGGAVAQAFLGLPNIRVVVLFPDGKVSPRQERQFSTLGRNINALAVQGDFDDCQRMVKAAFNDPEIREAVPLTSANSINVGRLIPQTFYYFLAWFGLAAASGDQATRCLFSVPSGNFGNLAAGLMARAMGLSGVDFLAATNANDAVPRYLETGRFRPRPSTATLSTAMDVGNPSNLSRILHLYRHDLDALRSDLRARRVSDKETSDTIRKVYEESGYILDPHSAVGFAALSAELDPDGRTCGVVLGTAHPAKFAEVVEPIIQEKIPLPPALAACLEKERMVTAMEPNLEALKSYLVKG